jgi:hypothetical protein
MLGALFQCARRRPHSINVFRDLFGPASAMRTGYDVFLQRGQFGFILDPLSSWVQQASRRKTVSGSSAHRPAKELSQNVADGMPTTYTQSSAYRSTAGHARSCSWAPRSSSENGGADRCAEDCASLGGMPSGPGARAFGCLWRRTGEYPPARLLLPAGLARGAPPTDHPPDSR